MSGTSSNLAKEQADQPTAYGEEPGPDDVRWAAAAEALAPDKSLTRVNANARATVTTVAVVGTLFTGLGLVSAQSLLADDLARSLALIAVGMAVLAVLVGLVYLALRLERVNDQNLADVERWYSSQFRRARLAVVASWLLVVAVLVAAAAATVSVIQSSSDQDPALELQLSGAGGARQLHAGVKVSGLAAGSGVVIRVVGVAGPCPEVVLLEGRSTADNQGKAEASSTIESLPCNAQFRLEVSGDGVRNQSLVVP